MNERLTSSWSRCWAALGAAGSGDALMQRLIAAYAEPQRYYHTQQHLAERLSLFDRYRSHAQEPGEVEMVLWFHDAIYDVFAADNEARSADWAETALKQAGVDAQRVATIQRLILITRHDALPTTADEALLVDIDLAILGAERARFAEYETQVRQEYAHVPEAAFRAGRAHILQGFLARQPLYQTPALQRRLEPKAQQNLSHSLQQLALD